jgi:hypothetical protein
VKALNEKKRFKTAGSGILPKFTSSPAQHHCQAQYLPDEKQNGKSARRTLDL